MRVVTPLRLVPGIVGLWTAARVAILMPDLLTPPAAADAPPVGAAATTGPAGGVRMPASGPVASTFPSHAVADMPFRIDPQGAGRRGVVSTGRYAPRPMTAARAGGGMVLRLSPAGIVAPAPAASGRVLAGAAGASAGDAATSGKAVSAPPLSIRPAPAASGGVAPPPIVASARSRWSGGAYLFRRGDGGGQALATGGQLGGSQAGARVAWRIDPADRFAAAARLATPLNEPRGAEAAAGVDWHPLPGRPLRVSVERRVDLGGGGRDAWSAYAAGGFWKPVGRGVVVDGYGQAGVVGARRRDLFADGAVRAGYRREFGESRSLTLGGGAWGAAQPGVARLDAGPRVAIGLPLAGTAVTAAAEWRVRVAGDATPGSGLAITLSADF